MIQPTFATCMSTCTPYYSNKENNTTCNFLWHQVEIIKFQVAKANQLLIPAAMQIQQGPSMHVYLATMSSSP